MTPTPRTRHRPPTPDAPPPTISVVIPVRDDAEPLRRCLRALAAQTRAPDEIVVVDNGSSDASAAVARDAGARVEPCSTPGIPAASAAGYDAAEGELILRLDADCVPGPEWVASIERAFAASPHVAAFSGGARFSDGPRMLRAPLAAAYLGAYGLVGMLSLGHPPLFGSNLAMRRDAWRSIRDRVHRENGLHDDFDLSFHLGERHRIRRLPRSAAGAAMGISMRPFADHRAFARRVRAGFRTALVHWPHDFPPVRWERRMLRAAVRRRHRRRSAS